MNFKPWPNPNLTQEDAVLMTLTPFIKQVWPESRLHLPLKSRITSHSKKNWHYKTELFSKESVLSFHMGADLKIKLHSSHLGVQACQILACYVQGDWRICLPVSSLQYIPPSPAEGSHDLIPRPSRPWQVPVDLFELQAPCHYWLLLKFL